MERFLPIREIMQKYCNSSREEQGLEAFKKYLEANNAFRKDAEQLDWILHSKEVPDYVKHSIVQEITMWIDRAKKEEEILTRAGAKPSADCSLIKRDVTRDERDNQKESLKASIMLTLLAMGLYGLCRCLLKTSLVFDYRTGILLTVHSLMAALMGLTFYLFGKFICGEYSLKASQDVYAGIGWQVQESLSMLEIEKEKLNKLSTVIAQWASEASD